MFVVDTHPLLWHLTEDVKLGRRAKEVLDKTDRGEITVIVPTIVLAEALFILEKKRADLEFKDVLKKIARSLNYAAYPLDLQIILKCQELKKIPEIHDRIIVATAKILGAKVLTRNRKIAKSGEVEVMW